MFFFISKEQFKFQVNNYVNRIIERYDFNEMESNINSINIEMKILKGNVEKFTKTLLHEDKQFNDDLSHINNEINYCKEKIKGLEEGKFGVDENLFIRIIQSELDKRLLNIKSDLSVEISRKLSNNVLDENYIRKVINEEIKRVNNESSNRVEIEQLLMEINNLKNLLQQEDLKNSNYIRKIDNQEKEISALTNTINKMQADIDKLSGIISNLKEDEHTEKKETFKTDKIIPSTSNITCIVFGNDLEKNNKYLENIINQTKLLREKIMKMFVDSEELNIYLKLIDKCILKIENLLLKNKNGDLEAEKLANDCAKIYKQTIVKAMSQKKLKALLEEYMRTCNFRKLEWYVGKKISEDDFEYLEEPILYENVDNKELDCTIREIKQDTYIIDYIDDEEKYEVVIPGIYCLGKFRK